MIKLIKGSFIALFALSGVVSGTANAGIYTFDLFSSEFGAERPPNYGLRLDGLYSGNQRDVYTFEFDGVTMSVDSDLGTARIFGDLIGGTEGDGEARTNSWAIDFTYTDLLIDTDGSWEFQDGVSGGEGTLSLDLGAGNFDSFFLVEFMGSDGFGPDGDGVNCRGTDGPWCGNGWLNHSITPNLDANDPLAVANLDRHLYASDFLYQGAPVSVSEPGTLALLCLGFAGLAASRRRK